MSLQIEKIISSQEQQLEMLKQEMKGKLSEKHYQQFRHFLSEKLMQNEVREIMSDNGEKLVQIYEQMKYANNRDFQLLFEQYVKTINTADIMKELRLGIDKQINRLKDEYNEFLKITAANSPFPQMIQRYHVNDQMFELYKGLLTHSLKDLTQLFVSHQQNLTKLVHLLNKIAIRNKQEKNYYIVAKVASFMIAGPLGSAATTFLFSGLNQEENIESTMALEDVRLSWTRIEVEALPTIEFHYRNTLSLIYYTLFGGAALRIAEDSKVLGYQVETVESFLQGLTFTLTEEKKNGLYIWVNENALQLEAFLKDERFSEAEALLMPMVSLVEKNLVLRDMRIPVQFSLLKGSFTLSEVVRAYQYEAVVTKAQKEQNELLPILEKLTVHNRCLPGNALSLEELVNKGLVQCKKDEDLKKWHNVLAEYILRTRYTESYKDCLVIENDQDPLVDGFCLLNEYLVGKSVVSKVYVGCDEYALRVQVREMLNGTVVEPLIRRQTKKLGLLAKFGSYFKQDKFNEAVNFRHYLKVKQFLKGGLTPPLGELNICVETNQYFFAKLLLEYRADVDYKGDKKELPIIQAIMNENLRMVNLLLAHNANINIVGNGGEVAAIEAMRTYNHEIVHAVLKKPLKADLKDAGGINPVMMSFFTGDKEIIDRMVQYKVNISDQYSVFQALLSFRYGDIVKEALKLGFSPNWKGSSGRTIFSEAVSLYSTEIMDVLLEAGGDPSNRDRDGYNTVQYAMDLGVIPIAEHLMDKNDYINHLGRGKFFTKDLEEAIVHLNRGKVYLLNKYIPNLKGYTEKHFAEAVLKGEDEKAKFLANTGIHVDIKFRGDDRTPLIEYILRKEPNMVKAMINAGADLHQFDSQAVPLWYAIIKEEPEIVRMLLEAGANPNQVVNDRYGSEVTPFVIAVTESKYEEVQLCLEFGADPNLIVKDKDGIDFNGLLWSVIQEDSHLVELLLKHGGNPNYLFKGENYENTFLNYAIEKSENTAIVELLINHGADVNKTFLDPDFSDEELTPLMLANILGKENIIKVLVNRGATPMAITN
jgi:uncharacterized protein